MPWKRDSPLPVSRRALLSFLSVWLAALVSFLLLSAGPPGAAQGSPNGPDPDDRIAGPSIVVLAGDEPGDSYIPPPVVPPSRRAQAASITVSYTNFPVEARAAFQFAVDIWASQLHSTVPIQVNATWTALGAGVLGSAGPESLERNFQNAPVSNTYYAVALANKLAGADLDPGSVDISANFNSGFSNWFFGTAGGTPSNQYDFVSVVLHELGHGLGFFGSMTVSGNQGFWGYSNVPVIYDRFAENAAGQRLLDTSLFSNPSSALRAQLTGGNLYFNGPNANAGNGGSRVKLYAPGTWRSGSSYSHLDETAFPGGSASALMTYALNPGEAIHNPGAVTLGMLKDLGWSLSGDTDPPPGPATRTPTRTATPSRNATPTRTPTAGSIGGPKPAAPGSVFVPGSF